MHLVQSSAVVLLRSNQVREQSRQFAGKIRQRYAAKRSQCLLAKAASLQEQEEDERQFRWALHRTIERARRLEAR